MLLAPRRRRRGAAPPDSRRIARAWPGSRRDLHLHAAAVKRAVPRRRQGHGGPGWWGLAWLTAAFVVLVPIRGWLKTRLPEPATLIQELGKQALMWIGLVLLIYGFVVLFDGRIRTIHYGGYFNFWWGVWVSALGFTMLVPLRARTLREEFRGTVRIMTATIADLPDPQRRAMLQRRLATLAGLPESARQEQLWMMMAAVNRLPDDLKDPLMATRDAVLRELPVERRAALTSSTQRLAADDGQQ